MGRSGEPRDGRHADGVDGVTVSADLTGVPATRSTLTPRQREIAALLARGLPNAEIAQHLVVSTGTVANHVARILQRLELESRTQVASWAIEHGLHSAQDRLLVTLERLLEAQPPTLKAAMDHVATLVAEALDADKVDAFVHDPATSSLYAIGTSDTPLGRKQLAIGLDRQAIADGGRTVQVFVTGEAHVGRDVQRDEEELIGVRRELNVRSQLAVPLDVDGERRGVLTAQSMQPDFFAQRDLLFLRAVSRWVANTAQRAELAERNAAAAIEQGRRLGAEELVTVVAHDLRNYLAPIRGRVDMLERRASRADDAATVRDALDLRKSVDRLGRLVEDLLDVARIDQGLFELTVQPTDLVALVYDAAEGLGIPGTMIDIDAPAELRVLADPAKLRQAVENLLANAVHHAPADTSVSVRLGCEASPLGLSPSVVVADQGPGIEPRLLPHLFERFARSSASTGLGIGLYLARQIVDAHGGRIDVVSAPGRGTQFKLVLPPRAVHTTHVVESRPLADTLGSGS